MTNLWIRIYEKFNAGRKVRAGDKVLKEVSDKTQTLAKFAEFLWEHKQELPLDKAEPWLEFLNDPAVEAVLKGIPVLSTITGILKLIFRESQLGFEDSAKVVARVAYFESIQQFCAKNEELQGQLKSKPVLQKLAQKIDEVEEFSERDAKDVLFHFHESSLAGELNSFLEERLTESGLEAAEAKIVAERISRGAYRYERKAIADLHDTAKELANLCGTSGWKEDEEKQHNLDEYLWEIGKATQERIFGEEFTYQDLYVPLEVKPVVNGEMQDEEEAIAIEEWAEDLLLDSEKGDRVLFLQGGPGRGKSVFCRMFAERVRQRLYPIWTPIVIRLRDVGTLYQNFEETLERAVGWKFAQGDWLKDRNTRFLFFLDGFDELLLERGSNRTDLQAFLYQVSRFQDTCTKPDYQHRILITGRPLALFGIEREMPPNLERVELMQMSDELQERWLAKWEARVGAEKTAAEKTAKFREFLRAEDCPEEVQKLAREPLLLFLLARMHRDEAIAVETFAGKEAGEAKVAIYDKALEWVLEKQRCQGDRNLNEQIMDMEDLRNLLAEAALCVVQSGNERAKVKFIEERLLERGDTAAQEIEKARKTGEEQPLKNHLATFYLRAKEDSSVEFFHKSFSEYLYAIRICDSLHEWTRKEPQTPRRREPPNLIKSETFHWQVYDLLGYGGLTKEIVEYVRVLLKRDAETNWETLYKRLNDFYLRWSEGEFIGVTDRTTLPQRKAGQLKQYGIKSGQCQADVHTGLNVLILLLEIHRHAQATETLKDKINFHPCGRIEDERGFERAKLYRITGYCNYVELHSFKNLIGKFLSSADFSYTCFDSILLSSVDFSYANLSHASLRRAILDGANLINANLEKANLNLANLSDANLSFANLNYANFIDANLRNANLNSADLSYSFFQGSYLGGVNFENANLSSVNFEDAELNLTNLKGANLSKVQWNERTRWFNAYRLQEAINVPEALAKTPEFSAAYALSRGEALARKGQIAEALDAYKEAQNAKPDVEIDIEFWNTLCWYGCLNGRASDVLFAADKAVELNPDWNSYRDTRGLARALTGDLVGAAEDFQAFLNSCGTFIEEQTRKRQRWLAALRQNQNPFTLEEIEKLRQEED